MVKRLRSLGAGLRTPREQAYVTHCPLGRGPWRSGRSLRSWKRLDDHDLLVEAEAVEDAQQVLPAARHLPLHGQPEVLLHPLGDPSGHRVVSAGRGGTHA